MVAMVVEAEERAIAVLWVHTAGLKRRRQHS